MEWVEVRGETLEAAKEEALDQLGVAHDDAEFEVVQEPESRWLGFKKTEARVRARVRPTQPRPKKEGRGNRRRRGPGGGNGGGQGRGGQKKDGRGGNRQDGGQKKQGGAKQGGGNQSRSKQGDRGGQKDADRRNDEGGRGQRGGRQDEGQGGRSEQRDQPREERKQKPAKKETAVSEQGSVETMPVEEQQATAEQFLAGLASGFGFEASVSSRMDDEMIISAVDGDDLGLMIGPKGGTMHAIQELTRAAVQRQSDGRDTGRLLVDVAGYRDRRRAALATFAGQQAERVVADGVEVALEPMNSADRKAVHDAVLDIDGVRSISEGDDPRRRVVLLPDSDD